MFLPRVFPGFSHLNIVSVTYVQGKLLSCSPDIFQCSFTLTNCKVTGNVSWLLLNTESDRVVYYWTWVWSTMKNAKKVEVQYRFCTFAVAVCTEIFCADFPSTIAHRAQSDREASLIKKEYCRCGPHPLQVISSRARPPLVKGAGPIGPLFPEFRGWPLLFMASIALRGP